MRKWLALLTLFAAGAAYADTPPARTINSETYDAVGNGITSHVEGGSIGLDIFSVNPTSAPENVQLIWSGAAIDPRNVVQSGIWNLNNITGTVSLPTNAAKETGGNLASILTALGSPFQAGGSIGNTAFGISGTLPAYASTPTFNLGTLNGAATAANQTTANGYLLTLSTNVPAQGQALAAASMPVVLPAAQISALTPPTTVTVIQPTGTNLHTVVDSSALPTGAAQDSSLSTINTTLGSPFQAGGSIGNTSFGASQLGAPWTVTGTGTAGTPAAGVLTVQGNASGTPLPISGTITATNSANGNTGAAVPAQATQMGGSDGTDLRALSVNASGQLNINNVSGIVSLPTGAATDSELGTINSTLGSPFQVGGSIGNTSFGATQATAANLNATVVTTGGVTIAKDSSLTTINSTLGSPFQAGGSIGNTAFGISGTLPAFASTPTVNLGTIGTAATAANQTNGSQQSKVTDGTNIAAVKAASTAAIVTDTALVVAVSPNNTPVLPSGAATNSELVTINSTLGSPFQAGGSIGNTSFAATQGTAANLNATVVTTGGTTIAKDSSLSTINTTLGTPFQAGGSIGNTSFGISGTLPAFASTPTVNLGTIGSAATAANQTNGTQQTEINNGANIAAVKAASTAAVVGDPAFVVAISPNNTPVLPSGAATNSELVTINSTLGSPFQAGGSIGNASFGATQATAANLNATVVTTGGVTIAKDSSLTTINSTLGTPMQNSGGSVTANAGTNLNTSLLALQSGAGTHLDKNATGSITTTCSTPTTSCPAGSFVALSISGVGSGQVQLSGTYAGATLNVDGTADGTNWVALETATGSSGTWSTASFSPATNATTKYRILRVAGLEQIRLRASAFTSGSLSAQIDASAASDTDEVIQLNAVNLNAQVVGDSASGASDSASNPLKIGGVFSTTQSAVTDGQRVNFAASPYGDLSTADNTKYDHISTNTTTIVKSGAGLLYRICTNVQVAGATDTIYDNTTGSGAVIGVGTAGSNATGFTPQCENFGGVRFNTGLTIVTAGGPADYTVTYK